ncbi:MAG: hypothetical protein ACI4N4_00280 [Candidatus Fimenecus sp.]
MVKSTTELLNELKEENCSLNNYIGKNDEHFIRKDIKNFWEEQICNCDFSKSNIINKSDFSYCYFYDVINGRKLPTRDKIVRLALVMHMNLDKCQEALKLSGRSALYPKFKRDSIIIFAIENGLSIARCNEQLVKYGEDELK